MRRRYQGALESAVAACLKYLLNCQSPDGYWTDWQLPPGESSAWTTGFIGYKLHSLPPDLLLETATARRAAAQWLLENESPGGGWGYNETVGADADSTAYGILFLSLEDIEIPDRNYQFLRKFQCPDGGFSTYRSDDGLGSWGVSHPEVSAIALLALMTKYSPRSPIIQRGIKYILGEYPPSGLWNSFWWPSPLYGTEASLSLLCKIGVRFNPAKTFESLIALTPHNPFESALLISCILHTSLAPGFPVVWPLVDQLIAAQQLDGSWNSEPILRLTRRDCCEPWKFADAGPMYADPNRLFTSSTVLGALCQAHAFLP